MELIKKSAINEFWKLCTLAGFLGLFLLTLLVTTTHPPTFQISITTTTFNEVSSAPNAATPPPFVETSVLTDASKGGESHANETTFDNVSSFEDKMFSSSPNSSEVESTNSTSEVALIQSVNSSSELFSSPEKVDLITTTNETSASQSLEEKLFGSTPEVVDPITATTNTTTETVEYEIPTNETNYSNSTNIVLTESSFNASQSLEEVVDPITATANTTTGTLEYEIPTGEANKKCRMYEGRWEYKPQENPGYQVYQCPFLEDKMSCRKNGRPDSDYENWGWESDDCQVPLFNGTDMLERLRGKRMIIAGDSLNRNQWESLACLLYSSIPPTRAFVDAAGPAYKVLKAMDYEFTLEFYWAPFLVHLDETHKSGRKVLFLDKMVPFAEQWRGADVMVFNSGHWWTHHGKLKAWDVFEYDEEQVEEMENELAYERALTTWAQWVAHNVDPTKTKIYFRSISPEHKGKQWCFNHTQPMAADEPYYQMYPRSMTDVLERKVREVNSRDGVANVRYLNITGLSSRRIDAHPSIFRFKHWKVITEKYKRLLPSRSDCSHWCLPGLPDTWNRILYASLFFDHLSPGELSTS